MCCQVYPVNLYRSIQTQKKMKRNEMKIATIWNILNPQYFFHLMVFIVVGWRFDDCKPHTRAHICSRRLFAWFWLILFFVNVYRKTYACLSRLQSMTRRLRIFSTRRITSFEVPGDMRVFSVFVCFNFLRRICGHLCDYHPEIAAGWWNVYFSYIVNARTKHKFDCVPASS